MAGVRRQRGRATATSSSSSRGKFRAQNRLSTQIILPACALVSSMSSSSLPMMAEQEVQRPPSIRSVASNSSIASGVSLTRRSRTRTRSKTVTSRQEEISVNLASELPYIDIPFVQEPEAVPTLVSGRLIPPPDRPPRSPQRIEGERLGTPSSQGTELVTAAEATFVDVPQSSPGSSKMSKAARLASNLPVIETSYKPPPSAFSRDPALAPVSNIRDSVSTQQSGTSSSLYPPSTSTASGPESPPSPRSMAEQIDQLRVSPFDPEVNEMQDYDGDDVAYRLRLLVKNNYFLPPAHSKPSPSDFASSTVNPPKKSPRTATPAFLDLFRVGKLKSKPTNPTSTPGIDPTAPMLRTAADSITASYALRPQQPRSSTQMPRLSPHSVGIGSRGRVVVVREKMNDISIAAKQAEQELKNRGVRLDQGSQKAKQEVFDDVIDPTDAVDLPPPSSNYPFAVQASALHGLGVQDSLGAAVLADRLPPPTSPNASSSYDTDDDWRKALLHEAVHHSLDATPDASTFSHILGASTPLASPRLGSATSLRGASPHLQRLESTRILDRRILDQPMIDSIDASHTVHVRNESMQSEASAPKGDANGMLVPPSHVTRDALRSSYLPIRAETPLGPLTPLTPPPRRHLVNPPYSLSQTDLTNGALALRVVRSSSQVSHHTLRRTMSSPMLSEGYESAREAVMTPPPMPTLTVYSRASSQVTDSSFDTVRHQLSPPSISTSESHYSDEDFEEEEPRTSIALSAMNGRPSLSEYSLSSPTTSAFQEALNNGGFRSPPSSAHGPSRFSIEQHRVAQLSPVPTRYSTTSPPPRMSSSLAHVALPPPPRSSSLRYPKHQESFGTVSQVEQNTNRLTMHFDAPEPTTPPLPLSERRRGNHDQHMPLSLEIPPTTIPVAIHSAPGPSSPTSFFDSIQTQPNAMDDLESSSESEDEEIEAVDPRPALFVDPRTRTISSIPITNPRPSIMKLGNHSTPYIGLGRPVEGFRQNLLPIGGSTMKKPIGNIPVRAPFFTDRKSDQGHGHTLPSTTYDFYRYAQDHPPVTAAPAEPSDPRRPKTTELVTTWRNNQRAQESLRKLDGLLIQHMEAEKDTIKRIATTMKQTNTQQAGSSIPP